MNHNININSGGKPNKNKSLTENRIKKEDIKEYVVTRKFIDYKNDKNGLVTIETNKGVYLSKKVANLVAKEDLLIEWNEDFFEDYIVHYKAGLVEVIARCPEGEEFIVTVSEKIVKSNNINNVSSNNINEASNNINQTSNNIVPSSTNIDPSSASSIPCNINYNINLVNNDNEKISLDKDENTNQKKVYIVILKTQEQYNDGDNEEIIGVFTTKVVANLFATNYLYNNWGEDFFEDYEDNGDGRIEANCGEGEHLTVYIVEKDLKENVDDESYIKELANSSKKRGKVKKYEDDYEKDLSSDEDEY